MRKLDVQDAVETQIEAEASQHEVGRLTDGLVERLDDAPDEDDFYDQPISAMIARICGDLGLTPDWSLWRNEDWAVEEADTRPRGPPYAAPARGWGRVTVATTMLLEEWDEDEDGRPP
ncbi:MAG TPA: hypothetical protein VGI79_15160 [Caulobacteraceae bacterium]|jgi:hypothetical protein